MIFMIFYLIGALASFLFIQNRSKYIHRTHFSSLTQTEYFDPGYYALLVFSTILWPVGLFGFLVAYGKYL